MTNLHRKNITTRQLPKSSASNTPWTTNISQRNIAIAEDKLKLILIDTRDALQSRRNWIAPVGIIISCIVTLTTTNSFKSPLGIDMYTLIWGVLIVCSVWLIYELQLLYKNWNKGDITYIINAIKNKNNKAKQRSKK